MRSRRRFISTIPLLLTELRLSTLNAQLSTISGSSTGPISIQAQGTNAVVTPTTDRSDNRDTIFIVDSTYIVLDGFRSFNANRAALRIEGGDHVTVRNCVFGNNAMWGILVKRLVCARPTRHSRAPRRRRNPTRRAANSSR